MLWLNSACAQTRPLVVTPASATPEHFMYVGNSFFYYNNGMPGYVSRLADGAPASEGRKLTGTMVTIAGSGFDWHDMESYFRPHGIGYYTFDKNNVIVFTKRNKLYDAVIMMDCSQCPIHPQLAPVFTEYARKNADIARRHDAEPMLFMSWAYQDKPEMTEKLAEAYTREGNANHLLVIPAGLAFARVVKERSDLNLYQPDKRHPTLMGTYLAASTIYAAVTGRPSEANEYTAGLDAEVARYLRAAAWAVTREYFGAEDQKTK
jgi:hypothetical protein